MKRGKGFILDRIYRIIIRIKQPALLVRRFSGVYKFEIRIPKSLAQT